jgi:hypothetical protein
MTPEGPLDNLIQYTSQWTNDAISALFENVDTQLFEMAEKSENASDQNTYFDAMRIIRLRRSVAFEEFITNVSHGFNIETIQSEKNSIEVISDMENLTLVADDNLEEDLATHSMVAKAERANKDNLTQLNQRLSYLYNGLTITAENNPMGPVSLCNSFALATDTLEAEIKVKLLVFKLFDINFISKLNDLYDGANQLLVGKKILPDLKVSYKSALKRPPHPDGAGLGGHINTPSGSQSAGEGQQEDAGLAQFMQQPMQQPMQQQPFQQTVGVGQEAQAFALIQQLIAQTRPAPQQIPQAQYASTEDIMSSLSQIQVAPELYNNTLYNHAENQADGSGTATSNLLKEALKQSLQSNQQKQAINQNDDDIIDNLDKI